MTARPCLLWFDAPRLVWLHQPGNLHHLFLFHAESGRCLGELLPRAERLVCRLPDGGGQFTLVACRGRAGTEAWRRGFMPMPSLQPRWEKGTVFTAERARWTPAGDTVELAPLLRPHASESVLAKQGGWAVPNNADDAFVLTPWAGEVQGPSEIVVRPGRAGGRLLDDERAWELASQWPEPVLQELVAALSGGRQDALVRLLSNGSAPGLLAVVRRHKDSPADTHLLAGDERLLRLAERYGVPPSPWSAATFVLRALGVRENETARGRLEVGDGEELGFWLDLLTRPVPPPADVLSALFELRCVIGCPAPVEAAPRLLGLYRFLKEEDLAAVRAELLDGQDLAPGLARGAERKWADALAAPTERSLNEAAQAHSALRKGLKDHLDQLVAKRPGGAWKKLGDARQELDRDLPLRATAARFEALRQGRPHQGPLPQADPPCLFQFDAVWLRGQSDALAAYRGRILCWIDRLLQAEQWVDLASIPAGDVPSGVTRRLAAFQKAWADVDVVRVALAVGWSEFGRRQKAIREAIDEAKRPLGPGLGSPSFKDVVEKFEKLVPQLALSLYRDDARRVAEERLTGLDRDLRGREVREKADSDLRAARGLLAGPPAGWATMPETVARLHELSAAELASNEAWHDLCESVPASLWKWLGLTSVPSALSDGPDAVADAVEPGLAQAADLLTQAEEAADRRRDVLHRLTDVVGLLPHPLDADGPAIQANDHLAFRRTTYRRLLDLARRAAALQQAEARLDRETAAVREQLPVHVATMLAPPRAPGIEGPLSPAVQADIDEAVRTLLAVFDTGRLQELAEMIARLDRVTVVLAARRDVLGLELSPAGADLVRPSAASAWARLVRGGDHRDDRRVGELRDLAARVATPADLITDPERLKDTEAALQPYAGVRPRWWSRLYRDLAEVARGRLDEVDRQAMSGQLWSFLAALTRSDLGECMRLLAEVEAARRTGQAVTFDGRPVPDALVQELARRGLA